MDDSSIPEFAGPDVFYNLLQQQRPWLSESDQSFPNSPVSESVPMNFEITPAEFMSLPSSFPNLPGALLATSNPPKHLGHSSIYSPDFPSQLTVGQESMASSGILLKRLHDDRATMIPEYSPGTSCYRLKRFRLAEQKDPIAEDSRTNTPELSWSVNTTPQATLLLSSPPPQAAASWDDFDPIESSIPIDPGSLPFLPVRDVATNSTTPASKWHHMDWPKAELSEKGSTPFSVPIPACLPAQSSTHRYITPDHAQQHIINKKHAFESTLANWGYEGTYSLHSGFNQESIYCPDPEEEIYIVLDSEVSEGLQNGLEELALPFTGIIIANVPGVDGTEVSGVTSEESMDSGAESLQGKSQGSGEEKDSDINDHSSGSERGGNGGGGIEGSIEGEGGGGIEGGGSGSGEPGGKGNSNSDGGNDDGGDGGPPGSNESDGSNTEKESDSNQQRGPLHIPFSSRLVSKDSREKFEINGHIKVTVTNEEVDLNIWPGPLLEVDMRRLQVTSKSWKSTHSLSLCQVRIMASSCNLNVLNWSPQVIHAEDSSRVREERNLTGTASMTISMNPSLRIDGRLGTMRGTEREQQPWIISSDQDEMENGKGILWDYRRNLKGGFRPVTTEHFHPSPTLMFGLDNTPLLDLPQLEIRVIIFWSYEKEFLSSLRRKSNNDSGTLPANLNFLHQISMVVDLKYYQGMAAAVMKGTVEDEIPSLPTSTGGCVVFPEHTLGLSSSLQNSFLEIVIKQAVEGRVQRLTRGEHLGSDLTAHLSRHDLTATVYPSPGPSPEPCQ